MCLFRLSTTRIVTENKELVGDATMLFCSLTKSGAS
jgi:hypothetical protein